MNNPNSLACPAKSDVGGRSGVSVVILNYRSPRAAIACVRDLQHQTCAHDLEIILVDNHSNDDSIGLLRNQLSDVPNLRIVETRKNHGFGSGYNAGIRYARGKYLLINNPDKRLQPDGIERMVKKMESDAGIGIIGPKMIHPDGSRRLSIRRDPRPIDVLSRRSILGKLFPHALKHYLMLDAAPDSESEVDWVVGGCFMTRLSLFRELGGFDERFFLFFEDTDLCRRCRDLGKKVLYVPDVTALDKPQRLSGESLTDLLFTRIGRIHMISGIKYFWKWGI